MTEFKLTQYSRGAGCGCKIAPAMLEEILHTTTVFPSHKNLLVGNRSNDDAAVYNMGDGKALISSTDFFMPIVDDALSFGKIASANSISDIYAMGGKPLMAIAVLGWPVETLPATLAQQVLEGARIICEEAGIPLAGGHSIDATEPIFGLAVTGIVDIVHLKKNNTAAEGDILFITKPIGTGILSTAQKRGVINEEHIQAMIQQMCMLNTIGEKLGKISGVSAMTDVTGFGLLGHLMEMAEGANVSAQLIYNKIPAIEGAKEYLQQRIVPDATYRNWNSYSKRVAFSKGVNVMEAFNLLPDPQTNGGILFSVHPSAVEEIQKLLADNHLENFTESIGKIIAREDKVITVMQD